MEPTVWSNSTSYFLPILADTLFLELPSHVKGLIEFVRGKYIGKGMRGKKSVKEDAHASKNHFTNSLFNLFLYARRA